MKSRRCRSDATDPSRRTIAYVRVSTEDQVQSGVSICAQEARIASYCAAMGWDVTEVITDAGASAKRLQRPGMSSLLQGVRAGTIGRVVVLKLDRLTRSVRDLGELLELFARHETALVAVSENLDTGSAAGRMVVNMLGVVAQWEREAIAERTAAALAHKRAQRRPYGCVPFGYRREGDALQWDAKEQAALAEAIALDRASASFREIGRMLEARAVRPHRGKVWHASSVRAMLRSRMVAERAEA